MRCEQITGALRSLSAKSLASSIPRHAGAQRHSLATQNASRQRSEALLHLVNAVGQPRRPFVHTLAVSRRDREDGSLRVKLANRLVKSLAVEVEHRHGVNLVQDDRLGNLKNARVINVFTNEIEQADVAIHQGVILGVGHYTGETELDLQGKYVCPGLVDGHIHIESSMLCGPAFEQAVLPHGTTAVVTDPHEISNVAGTAGLDFMLETTKDLALSVYFMLPSCVPATGLDESGAVLEAEQLRPYYGQPRVLGLAELMNSYGTVRADEKILQKICDCTAAGKKIDGHAPFLSGEELNAYVVAGVQSDQPMRTATTGSTPAAMALRMI